jgi:hypothetical protein
MIVDSDSKHAARSVAVSHTVSHAGPPSNSSIVTVQDSARLTARSAQRIPSEVVSELPTALELQAEDARRARVKEALEKAMGFAERGPHFYLKGCNFNAVQDLGR